MNYLLHCHRSPGNIVPIPEELQKLMADISCEVLRSQPKNILTFIADYLETMLLIRESAIAAETMVDNVIGYADDITSYFTCSGMPKSRARHVINEFLEYYKKIPKSGECQFHEQSFLRKLIDKCHFNKEEAKLAAVITRNVFKHLFNVDDVCQEDDDMSEADEQTFGDMVKIKDEYKHRESAAIVIQTAFRRYRARKSTSHTYDYNIKTDEETSIESIPTKSDVIKVTKYMSLADLNEAHSSKTKLSEINDKKRRSTRWEYISNSISSKLSAQSISDDQDVHAESKKIEAAKAIQSMYRGHKTRKAIQRYSCNPLRCPSPLKRNSTHEMVKDTQFDDLIIISPIKLNPRLSNASVTSRLSVMSKTSSIKNDVFG